MAEISKNLSLKLDKLQLVEHKDKELGYLIHPVGFKKQKVFILLVKDKWRFMMEIIEKGRVKAVYFLILIMDNQHNKILKKLFKIRFQEQPQDK